jgi:RNA polymerase sigma-70 factor (ECF subfamily)
MADGRSSTDSNERYLVEAAQADRRKFAELYELHFDRVYTFISRRVRDRAATQDLTSEVFHQALAGLDRYEPRGVPFIVWLLRIASNKIADHWHRCAKERGIPPPVESVDPDYEEIDRQAALFRAVTDLPEDQRRVIELRFVEQKSTREVAEQLQRSEGAIKQLQYRGLETLRARIGERNG